ncbi:MAG: hypothetical protein WCE90_04555 [Candidatus Zixiibacteriota bacterium]
MSDDKKKSEERPLKEGYNKPPEGESPKPPPPPPPPPKKKG